MALRVVHADRTEALLAALLEALPAANPFTPSTIVVGSHLVSRWLMREIAQARGIASGLELVTFDRFVEMTWGAGELAAAIDRRQLAAVIASVLADDRAMRELPAVASYLAAAPAPGDRAGPRRVQLADRLADVLWQYASTRSDWMAGFVAGRVPSELAADPTARWQVALAANVFARLDGAVPVPMLPAKRREARLAPARSAVPVSVFGMSFLVRSQLEALTDLAATSDVTVYMLDPCAELWDDVAGRGAIANATTGGDPLPLALWGRAARETIGALVERSDGDLDGRFSTAAGKTALARLLADARARTVFAGGAQVPAIEPGVTVLACPNPRRELELVAAEIRTRLDADPQLAANDIAVWIASNPERYLAQAPAAFEAVGVPCHLIDAPIDDRGRIGEAVLALLELPTSAMTRRDLLRVMTHPAVLAAFPHVEPDDWLQWTDRLGVAHGTDRESRRGTYLEDHDRFFHWDQAVRRLALGAFMVGERGERGPARIAQLEVAPEEVPPDQQASAASYALLVRSLCADAAWLATFEAPLTRWADVLVALVGSYLATRDDDAKRDLERVRAMLAGLARLDLDGRRVGFREAREHATRQLTSARAGRGEPLAHGVMLAPLAAMRAIPARIAFVVGLDEGAFPAGEQPSPLDVRTPRAGDISPRDRDRHAFLEALLGARDALFLSYTAVEAKSGQTLGPSSVVLELADALAPYLAATSSRDALERISRHEPLQRFHGDGGSIDLPPAIARERWAADVRDRIRDHLRGNGQPVPDEDDMFSLLTHPALGELRAALAISDAPAATDAAAGVRTLSVSQLRAFFESPVQAWARSQLGLDDLPDDDTLTRSDEPFDLAANVRATVLREALEASLRTPGREPTACYDAIVAAWLLRGQFPVGVFGSAQRAVDLELLHSWREDLSPVGSVTRYAFGRARSRESILRPALEIELSAGRTVRIVGETELLEVTPSGHRSLIALLGKIDARSKYHLRGALDHVLLAAAGLAPAGHAHVLVAGEGKARAGEHAAWTETDARAYLAAIATELFDASHGYLLPYDSLARLASGKDAAIKAERAHGFGPIESAYGLDLPGDALEIALRRLGPLSSRFPAMVDTTREKKS